MGLVRCIVVLCILGILGFFGFIFIFLGIEDFLNVIGFGFYLLRFDGVKILSGFVFFEGESCKR